MACGGGPARRSGRAPPAAAAGAGDIAVFYSVGIIVGHALDRAGGWSGGGPPVPADRTLEAAGLAALSLCFAVLALRAGQPIFASRPQPAPAAEPLAGDDPEAPCSPACWP